MKPDTTLIILSLVNIILMSVHLSADIVYGYEPARLNNLTAVVILAVWLYAALVLTGRRSGYVILLLGSLFAALMPVAHMSGPGVRAEVVESSGGLLFLWTLMALGASGTVSFALSVHGLWRLKRSIVGFVLWLVIPVAMLAGVLSAYLIYFRN